MINEEKQLDDFLKEGFNSKIFEQKPQYWKNAQKLVAANRNGKSNTIATYTLSAIMIIGVAATLIVNSSNTMLLAKQNNESNSTVKQSSETQQATDNIDVNSLQSGEDNTRKLAKNISALEKPTIATVALLAKNASRENETPTTNLNLTVLNHSSSFENINTTGSNEEIKSKSAFPLGTKCLTADTFTKKDFYQTIQRKNQRNVWVLEAGLNNYNNASVNIHGGIRFYHYLSSKLAISSGAMYSRLNQNLVRTYQNIDYGFGQDNQTKTISTKRLDYLEIPLSLHYNIKGNHYVTGGSQLGYAIQSRDEVTSPSNQTQTANSNGYLSAINRWDVQLNAGYSYAYKQHLLFSLNYYYGVADVSNNSLFKNRNFDRNSGLRLTIGYKLN